MDWKEIEKHWEGFERLFNYKWKLLTKADLQQIDGSKATLNTKLQGHYGESKAETNRQIDKFLDTFRGILKGKINVSPAQNNIADSKPNSR